MKKPFRTTDAQRKELRDLVREFRSTLYLHQWTINLSYQDFDDDTETAADITCQHEYFQASINIYPRFWSEKKADRKKMLLHELVHALLSEMLQQFRNLYDGRHVTKKTHAEVNERTTTNLTNIIFDLL